MGNNRDAIVVSRGLVSGSLALSCTDGHKLLAEVVRKARYISFVKKFSDSRLSNIFAPSLSILRLNKVRVQLYFHEMMLLKCCKRILLESTWYKYNICMLVTLALQFTMMLWNGCI